MADDHPFLEHPSFVKDGTAHLPDHLFKGVQADFCIVGGVCISFTAFGGEKLEIGHINIGKTLEKRELEGGEIGAGVDGDGQGKLLFNGQKGVADLRGVVVGGDQIEVVCPLLF